jgi:uncharacterized protein (TIGR00255 family)
MTGQGQAQQDGVLGTFSVEIRTVNNRGFKLVARLGDLLGRFESQIDATVRETVRRGSVQLNASWKPRGSAGRCRIDTRVVGAYYRQLEVLREEFGTDAPIDLARLASLPGGLEEVASFTEDESQVADALLVTVRAALDNLNAMRSIEGVAMQRQLEAELEQLIDLAARVDARAPEVVDSYRERLKTKIESFFRREGIVAEPSDLLREVQIFADRSDISEEITRLRSHFELCTSTIRADQSSGRKLDFVIQEMFRETNTIGSKAGDAEIARHVVDMKCGLERMRELVQNIE